MESLFKSGMVVRSRVNAQGMKVGETFCVVSIDVRRTPFGGFSTVSIARPGSSDVVAHVGNPHLVLEVVS